MSAIRIVIVLWGGLFVVLGMLVPPGDGDLWWQRWLGEAILRDHRLPTMLGPETFTAAGASWIPQEWLLSLTVALSMDHGVFMGLRLAISAIPVAILISLAMRARARSAPAAIAVTLLFAGAAMEGSFGVRAQVLGWGCFAAFLLCLERRDGWYYLSVPIVMLWANVHASAMLAPIYLGARVVGGALDGNWGVQKSRDARNLILVAVALLCTPFGWHLPAYAVGLTLSPIRHYIQEWQPVNFSDVPFIAGAFPIAVSVVLGGLRFAWRNKSEGLPILLLFIAMLFARRAVPLFAIAAAPLAAQALSARFRGIARLSASTDNLQRFAFVAIGTALVFTALALWLVRRDAAPTVPMAAISRVAADGGAKRVFCENFNDCSLALQYPNLRVFMDGRCDPYPLPVWKSYMDVIHLRGAWRTTLLRYGVSTVVALEAGRLAHAIDLRGGWRRTFDDGTFVVFSRT